MKGKKIVIVGPAYPYRGGLSTFNERFARELSKDNEVSICTFKLQYPGFLFPGQTQYSTEAGPEDLKITRSLNSVNPLNWIIQGFKFKKQKPDLIIFRYWMPFFAPCFGTFARIIKGNKHTKIITIADNIIPHEKRFFDSAFNAYFLPVLDGAVTMSRKVLQDLDDLHFTKPHLFNPHPLYDNFGEGISKESACKKLNLNPEEKYMLFFGFIRNYKGLDLLLKAMSDKRVKESGAKLIVAGEFYEDSKIYLDLIQNSGIADQVILRTDFIPNSEVATYFSAADLIVQPYRSATQSGVSQVAYHFSKPMIVTDVGGLAEFVPHNEVGFVCKPEPEDIAKYIHSFFTEHKPEEFQPGLQRMKKEFSWERLTQAIDKILE
ncbi:MAG: glycosyltransferase [Bacteroidetes bacterium]|nr:glycosyltransferase [Bacteroidota bacterium]